ncbi:MAG: pitrilysin family protein [Sedimentisphaerales bacterium]|nr:pitrilysin family protein [Sedimentisphaerales bacterium]
MPTHDQYIMPNGMVVLGQPMEAVQTAAFVFMLPAGSSRMPEGTCGAANVIADWLFRGAGDMDSRQLCDALDGLGLQRYTAVDHTHLTIGATMEASHLHQALGLYGEVISRPWLDPEQFELARQLAIDEVKALDDDPQEKVLLELKERFYPYPLGRHPVGRIDQLQSLQAQHVASLLGQHIRPSRAIFGVAGMYDFGQVCDQLEALFGQDSTAGPEPIRPGPVGPRYTHIPLESAQVHIGLMTPTVGPADPDYYHARVTVSILSGGMSSRLFVQVREKRGLCYAVNARYHCLKEAAGIICYAGTTPPHAQQTLQIIIDQFRGLSQGLTDSELDRAKAGLKSGLILSSESSTRRAAAICTDYHLLGRVRDLDQIKAAIDAVTIEGIQDFLARHPFDDFTVVTIGPNPVELPWDHGIQAA